MVSDQWTSATQPKVAAGVPVSTHCVSCAQAKGACPFHHRPCRSVSLSYNFLARGSQRPTVTSSVWPTESPHMEVKGVEV